MMIGTFSVVLFVLGAALLALFAVGPGVVQTLLDKGVRFCLSAFVLRVLRAAGREPWLAQGSPC